MDGLAGIRGGCQRCQLLLDIWQTAFRLNGLIRKFDPAYDDIQRPAQPADTDPRQMSLIDFSVMDSRGEQT